MCRAWLVLALAHWLLGVFDARAEFVAYNDHEAGLDTHTNTTTYAANGTSSGFLKDIVTGQDTEVILATSASGVSYESSTGVPAEGTDAATLFSGYVDFSTGHPHSLALSGSDSYTHEFRGLNSKRRYDFAGTAVRGQTGYTDRWTLITIEGADSFQPSHSAGIGIVTNGLAANEVALWTGENHLPNQGFVARWVDIDPGSDGVFRVISRQYRGATPGVGSGNSSSGSKGYGLNGIRLAETFVEGQPIVEMHAATNIEPHSAEIGGLVKDPGADDPAVILYYGQTNAGGVKSQWSCVRELGPQSGAFSIVLSGLDPGITYYYRALASNSVAEVWAGSALSFTTLVDWPQVQSIEASNVTAFTAEIGARITATGGEAPNVILYYGKTDGITLSNNWEHAVELGQVTNSITALLTDLDQGTPYYHRAFARNSRGGAWAPMSLVFNTLTAQIPSIENNPAILISQFSARLGGRVASTGGDAPRIVVCYGKTDGGTILTNWQHQVLLGTQSQGFAVDVLGLDCDTTYYYRAYAENWAGSAWADSSLSFHTLEVLPPELETLPPANVSAQSAVLRGRVIDAGGDTPHIWLVYGSTDGGTLKEAWDHALDLGIQTNTVSLYVRNLTPETPYYYRILGMNRAGDSWAKQSQSFKTQKFSPITIVINEIHYAPLLKTSPAEFIELYNAADVPIEISGWHLSDAVDFTFPENTTLDPGAYYVVAQDAAEFRRIFGREPEGVWMPGGRLANEGERVIVRNTGGEVVDEVEYQGRFPWPAGANRGGASMELLNPQFDNNLGGNWRNSLSNPTPGARNSVYRDEDLPVIRQVEHTPLQPRSQEDVIITVKATDNNGISQVVLEYQQVQPGDYIGISDTRYRSSWQTAAMRDDGTGGDAIGGDAIYSVIMLGSGHAHRELVRYRISATGARGNTVTVPYDDDPQPNFAYFVYDGVPSWTGSARPDYEPMVAYSSNLMSSLPVYHLITTRTAHEDAMHIPNSKRGEYWGSDYLWEGTLVYDGAVYDHIRFRARGGVWRYSMGKNMWKFDFNRGHEFQAKDDYGRPYQTLWDKMNFSALIQQGNFRQRGEQGLFEAGGFKLHNLAGNKASYTHFVHFRIVEDPQENGPTASQFDDDFQGLYLVLEQPDGRFLDEHGLPDGNLYKMEGGTGELNNQGPTQPTNRSDLIEFMTYAYQTKTADWWKQNLDVDDYYSFHAIMMAIHDYDKHAGKNYFYFNNPVTSRWSVHTWDLDLTWTTTYGGGNGQGPLNSYLFALPEFNLGYLNRMREIRDLLFNPEQTGMLLDEIARFIYTPGQPSFVDADRAMWDYNPILISSYINPEKAGHGRFYEAATERNFGAMLALEKNYVVSRGQWIDRTILTDEQLVPSTPQITYQGAAGYPVDDLRFAAANFSSPAGQSFSAIKWRIAQITDPQNPSFDPTQPRHYEITYAWESTELTDNSTIIQVPHDSLKAGLTYRVRARMKDSAGRWSHWSAPIQFVAGNPTLFTTLQNNLVITEVLYDPASCTVEESAMGYDSADFEFIELWNRGAAPLDLTDVRFTKGIDFDFNRGTITRLDPGAYVLVVRNQQAFAMRYGASLPVAGEYKDEAEGKLDNNGETIKLSFGHGIAIHEFEYQDQAPWPELPGSGGFSLTLRDPSGSLSDLSNPTNWISSTVVNGTPGGPDDPLAMWKFLYFDPNDDQYAILSANDADPDHDGLPNLWEYGFGTHPLEAGSNYRPIAALTNQEGQDFLILTFLRRSQDGILVYSLQVSEDLIHWETSTDWILDQQFDDPDSNGIQRVTYRQLLPVTGRPQSFVRLIIQLRTAGN